MNRPDLPNWVVYIQVLLLPFLAVVISSLAALMSYQQVKIAKLKLRFDLYSKRYEVYDAVKSFLIDITHSGELSNEALQSFSEGTREASFLFRSEINNFISELYRRSVALNSLSRRIKFTSSESLSEKLFDQREKQFEWMTDALVGLTDRFGATLRLDAIDPRPFTFAEMLKWIVGVKTWIKSGIK